jgi:ribose 5-phosphate isomerase B
VEKIAIASDHGGFELKEIVKKYLISKGVELDDLGTFSSESVDYPDYAHVVAQRIAEGKNSRAILICGTGIGMSITANRYRNVRAALCNDVYSAKMSRQHNDANVIVLGGRVVGPGLALEIAETWLMTDFDGGRHARRVEKIENVNSNDKE